MEISSDPSTTAGPTSPLLTEPGRTESTETAPSPSKRRGRENSNGSLASKNGSQGSNPYVVRKDTKATQVIMPLREEGTGSPHSLIQKGEQETFDIAQLFHTEKVHPNTATALSSTIGECPESTSLSEGTGTSFLDQETGNESIPYTHINGQKTIPKTLKLRLIPFDGTKDPTEMPFPRSWPDDDDEDDDWLDIDPDTHSPPPLDTEPPKSCLERNHDTDKSAVHFDSKANVKHYIPENVKQTKASTRQAPDKKDNGMFFTADIIPRPRRPSRPKMYFRYSDDGDEGENVDPTERRVMKKDGVTWYIKTESKVLPPQPVFGGPASSDRPPGHLMDGLRNTGLPPRSRELDLILTFYVPCDDQYSGQPEDDDAERSVSSAERHGLQSHSTNSESTQHEHEEATSGKARRREFLRMLSKPFRRAGETLGSCCGHPYHERM